MQCMKDVNKYGSILCLVLGLALNGCSLVQPDVKTGTEPVVTPKLIEKQSDHKIVPLEVVSITVVGEKDLSLDLRVQAEGNISFPMLGDIKVAGMTTREAENILREKLGKELLVDPQVSVQIKEYLQRSVGVTGEVNKPGAITIPGEQKWTIMEAISQAGGAKTSAATKRIEFSRHGRTTRLNLEKLKKESDAGKQIYVEPGDYIYVPPSRW